MATFRDILVRGTVIPASPLALTADRKFDERRQRAILRYYIAARAGGIAVGVHATQFEIRDPKHGLLKPILELAAEEMTRGDRGRAEPLVRIAGICGQTAQAAAEAEQAAGLGYHAGLLSFTALREASEDELIAHSRRVADVLPLVGFYLQPAVGGRVLSHGFWRRFATIEKVAAIKIAPFNRYRTIDVVRAVAESGREDIALYTGNDDSIVADLVTPLRFVIDGRRVERRIVGGLLGQWGVWTSRAVEVLHHCHEAASRTVAVPRNLLRLGAEITDANAAIFDAAHDFAGCIPGINEVLRRQGLMAGTWCLDPAAKLSPGQAEEIDRVYAAYPHLNDDAYVAEHLEAWLKM